MIITVLWEDQRASGRIKGFGPNALLVSCVADKLGCQRYEVEKLLNSVPKKGNGNVLKAAGEDMSDLLRRGPVFVVVDRDKAHRLWNPPAPTCMSGLRDRFRKHAPDTYELVFLEKNVETLLHASRQLRRQPVFEDKPGPDERDRELLALAHGEQAWREELLSRVPSFGRLVDRVANAIRCCLDVSLESE